METKLEGKKAEALTSIETLQQKAADSLNKLYQALKKEGYKMVMPVNFYIIAFAVEDTPKGYVFKPNKVVEEDTFKYRDEQPAEETNIVTKPTEPRFIDTTPNKKRNRVIMKGIKEGPGSDEQKGE